MLSCCMVATVAMWVDFGVESSETGAACTHQGFAHPDVDSTCASVGGGSRHRGNFGMMNAGVTSCVPTIHQFAHCCSSELEW